MRISISIFSFFLIIACVERINIERVKEFEPLMVVDGFISDDPGPYFVKLFRSSRIDDDLKRTLPFSAKTVTLFDNLGNSEVLEETDQGMYQTKATGIRGVIGRVYTLRIENRDGNIYESSPELMRASGSVDSIYYEFESYKPQNAPTQNGFRVYMDSKGTQEDNYFRWKFNGTYRVETSPELRQTICGQSPCPYPPPCSGYISNGGLVKVGSCTCCICWVRQVEDAPIVSDNQFVEGGKFKRVEVGYVPINAFTFFDKYKIEVEQLSLSQVAFDFWSVIKAQKEGATSLFQPAFGQAKTNILAVNGGPEAYGIFYASAKAKKTIVINRVDVPAKIPVQDLPIPEACDQAFDLASTIKPFDWD